MAGSVEINSSMGRQKDPDRLHTKFPWQDQQMTNIAASSFVHQHQQQHQVNVVIVTAHSGGREALTTFVSEIAIILVTHGGRYLYGLDIVRGLTLLGGGGRSVSYLFLGHDVIDFFEDISEGHFDVRRI